MGKLGAEIDRKQFAYPEEPVWLAQWVLGDVAERRPAKRQRESMSGMWMSRQGKSLGLRQSDQIERNYVAACALVSAGYTMKEAVSDIGKYLGRNTAEKLEVLRTGIYRFRSPFKRQLSGTWLSRFRDWTDWAVGCSESNLDFVAARFRAKGKPRQAKQFLKLAEDVRRKAVVLERGSLYRDAEWYAWAEHECQDHVSAVVKELRDGRNQHLVAAAFGNLARLYHEQGKFELAIPEYEKAASRWTGAKIVEELRALMVDWIGSEIEGCGQRMPPGPVPAYSGRWIPED